MAFGLALGCRTASSPSEAVDARETAAAEAAVEDGATEALRPLGPPRREVWPEGFDASLALELGRWLEHAPAARGAAAAALEEHGAIVSELEDGSRRHLLAEIAGRASSALLFVAPLPSGAHSAPGGTETGEADIEGTSAGLLIELARVLADREPAYGLRFVLVEVEPDARRSRSARLEATGLRLAGLLDELGGVASIRAVFSVDVRARPDLVLARDLRAHPVFRDLVWSAAAARGRLGSRIFPRETRWIRVPGLHRGLVTGALGLRPAVPLVDEGFARPDLVLVGSERGGPVQSGDARRALERSFGLLGGVLVEGVEAVMARLARIDAFPADPSRGDPPPPSPGEARPEPPRNAPSS